MKFIGQGRAKKFLAFVGSVALLAACGPQSFSGDGSQTSLNAQAQIETAKIEGDSTYEGAQTDLDGASDHHHHGLGPQLPMGPQVCPQIPTQTSQLDPAVIKVIVAKIEGRVAKLKELIAKLEVLASQSNAPSLPVAAQAKLDQVVAMLKDRLACLENRLDELKKLIP